MYKYIILFKLIIIIKPYTYACVCTYFCLYDNILSIVFFSSITQSNDLPSFSNILQKLLPRREEDLFTNEMGRSVERRSLPAAVLTLSFACP
jgi:hypothetical protein